MLRKNSIKRHPASCDAGCLYLRGRELAILAFGAIIATKINQYGDADN